MFARALKTNIVISIIVLLFLGMLLIDIVAVKTIQRDLIKDKISQANLLASIIKHNILTESTAKTQHLSSDLKALFAEILVENEFSTISLMGAKGQTIYAAGKGFSNTLALEKLMLESLEAGARKTLLAGKTWGVFWQQSRYLLLSAPVLSGDKKNIAVGMVIDLESIYHEQRKSQRFIMLYLVANTLLFALIGFYRLSRIYLEPINRLVSLAEDYQEEDGTFFPVRKEDNELNTLSKALNLMLTRISADKEKLRSSVKSLEKANLKLKKAQEEIIRAEKLASIGRLSSGIAHEIGNPIGIVMGYLELLKRKDIDAEETREYITRTENEINRVNTVIQQLLDLSRPSVKGAKRISAHDIIAEIVDVLKLQPLMSGIQLKLALKASNAAVTADPDQLRQVFLNLAINAADAIGSMESRQSGQLNISTVVKAASDNENTGADGALLIKFEDNGPGIPESLIGNIFDPFFTTKEPGKGTGLGLSVSFMIVESFGGTIKAENLADGGACMSICLPLSSEAHTEKEGYQA